MWKSGEQTENVLKIEEIVHFTRCSAVMGAAIHVQIPPTAVNRI